MCRWIRWRCGRQEPLGVYFVRDANIIHMHPYRSFINNYNSIPDKEWAAVKSRLARREIRKGEVLLPTGKICRHVWFLESGLMRYSVDRDGLDVSKFFTVAPYCFTSQRSFNTRTPSRERIEALEDGVLWQLTKADVDQLLDLPGWAAFVRALTQEVQFFTEEILEGLQNQTAEARYREMLQAGDPLLSRVPLKHLASFLGIAPQSLSRIRKRLAATKKS